jgi:hypothetical protein
METNDTHPLLRKEFGMIRHWFLWKKAWDEAEHAEQLMGLLHVAFDMETSEPNDWIERYRFLLDVADGFEAYDELKKPDDYPTFGCTYGTLAPTGIINERRQMRRTVATKAMQVLCDRVLRFEPTKGYQLAWRFTQPEIFEKLLWFFDDADRRTHGYNLSDRDDGRISTATRAFVRALIGNAWRFLPNAFGDRFDRKDEESIRAMFDAARPRFVRMLFRMGKLDLLVNIDKRWRDMGAAEMSVLCAVAKLRSNTNAGYGEYESRDEALCEGSNAAKVLIAIEACRREEERKRVIAQAEREVREAQEKLKQARI